MRASERPAAAPILVALAFLAVYLVWGSTYLAITFVVQTIPPFLMAGARFLVSGALLYGFCRWRGAPRPTAVQWRSAAIVGTLLLLGGNGLVVWAQQWVPSGLAALLVASVPLHMATLSWILEPGVRPRARGIGGLVLGVVGVAILVEPGSGATAVRPVFIGSLAVLLASLFWAIGSLYSRRADLPESLLLGTAMEMLGGGVALAVTAVFAGDLGRLDLATISARSWWSLAYLVGFGSFLGFTAYAWLLQVSTPAKVGTYAFVNPMVAVFLGWWLGAEAVGPRTLLAAGIIVGAVALITSERARKPLPALPATDPIDPCARIRSRSA